MDGVREIVFDTETTGFDAKGADRITEIGCIEIIDLLPTGRQFHCYLDLSGGRAMSLGLDAKPEIAESESGFPAAKRRPAPLVLNPSEDEIKAHREFIGSFKQTAVWEKVWARRERNRL